MELRSRRAGRGADRARVATPVGHGSSGRGAGVRLEEPAEPLAAAGLRQRDGRGAVVGRRQPAQRLGASRRLKGAPSRPDAHILVQELESFQMNMTVSASETEEWREWPHDDLLLAVAVAAWEGENLRQVSIA